jgi:mannose-binding lectin 1
VRGFLNDGNTDFKSHHSLDSLAFGHCQYAYRNLGRPSQIKIRHDRNNFKVEVDGMLCFESNKIQLPAGYNLGITAASAENPDSFEVFKLVVTTDSPSPNAGQSNNQQNQQQGNQQKPMLPKAVLSDPIVDQEVPAESIDQAKQFADLHNRLQSLLKHISVVQRDIHEFEGQSSERHSELKAMRQFPFDQFNNMERRLENIERSIEQIQKDVSSKNKGYEKQLVELKKVVRENHGNLMEGLPSTLGQVVTGHAPSTGVFIAIIVGSQAILALAFVIYKRRRSMAPKKYL